VALLLDVRQVEHDELGEQPMAISVGSPLES
jgi:hypothetical protein